jgi:NAD-dependent dihydropyrimidine dehydrogenase PreA subunit
MNLVIPASSAGCSARWARSWACCPASRSGGIDRDLTKCTDCNLCLRHCEGASDPQAALRKSECFVCFNCIDDCPEDALKFRFARCCGRSAPPATSGPARPRCREEGHLEDPRDRDRRAGPWTRRRWVFAGIVGVLTYPFLRYSKAVNKRSFNHKAIRPPGTVAEPSSSSAVSSATSASTSARPTCCSRRRWRGRASRACGRR